MEGGIAYRETDFILFQAQILDISSVAFKVEISLSTDDFPGEVIGFCFLMPRHFKSTTGRIFSQKCSKGCPVTMVRPLMEIL
jgi:hypothetical protein